MAVATDELTDADREAIDSANQQPDHEGPGDDERTLEEIAAEAETTQSKPTPPTQLAIEGTRDKLSARAGGKVPTESEIRIMGGRRPITGEIEKGETVTVLSTGTIREVDFVDTDDDWGNVSKTTRVHKMRQLHVRIATDDALMRMLVDHGLDRQAVGILYDQVTGG